MIDIDFVRTSRGVVSWLIAASITWASASASAATLTVNTFSDGTTDDSSCTLREAVRAANLSPLNDDCGVADPGGNTIVLNAGAAGGEGIYVISSSTAVDVSRTLTIQGPSMWTATIRVDGSSSRGIGVIAPSGNLILRNVTITKGSQSNGVTGLVVFKQSTPLNLTLDHVRVTNFNRSGIKNDTGNLFVTSSIISNNSSTGDGGGINVLSATDIVRSGKLVMDRSAVTGNYAAGNGGGLSRITEGHDSSSIDASTFADNHAALKGGGIYSRAINASYLGLRHVTVANNSADVLAGGISEDGPNGSVQTTTCILNDNLAPEAMDIEGTSFIDFSIVTNLDDHHTFDNVINSRVGGSFNARLGSLMYVGGPTPVLPLIPQVFPNPSPAIDFGPTDGSGCLAAVLHDPPNTPNDQRSYGCPKNGGVGLIADVGAFEYDPAALVLESENEPVLAKSSDTYTVVSGGSYSNGKGVNLAADLNGDFIIFPVGVLVAGNYSVKVRVKKGANEGIFQLSRSTTLNGTQTPIGSPQDLYSMSNSWTELTISSSVPLTAGQTYFKFAVTGRNSLSSGRQLFIDYVKVTKL